MKIAHFTDVHFHRGQQVGGLVGKRGLGLANLYLRGRRHSFDADRIVPQLVRDILGAQPDLVIFSGDLTALSTEAEFLVAYEALEPLLRQVHTIVIPGNHDRYAPDAHRRMEAHFGPWMIGGVASGRNVWEGGDVESTWPRCFQKGDLFVHTTDASRPGVLSEGRHHVGELDRLRSQIKESGANQSIVVGHYPVWDRDGTPYRHRGRSLRDQEKLARVLDEAAPVAYLHGHEHAWFYLQREQPVGVPHYVNCGSSSYVGTRPGRSANYFLLEFSEGLMTAIQRHEWDGSRFLLQEDQLGARSA